MMREPGMQNIINLQRRGLLTEQQLFHAYRFAKNPNGYNIAPALYRILHDAIIADEPLEAMEKRRGWAARSAKVVIGLTLHALQEMGGTHIASDDEGDATAREKLAYVTADDAQDYGPIMRQFGFTHMEARLFLVLKRSPNQTCGKEALLARLYANRIDDMPDVRMVDVWVCKMRKKLANTTWRIETIWGEGYQIIDRADPTVEISARDIGWYNEHVNEGVTYREIARRDGVEPSAIMRAINRLINDNTDEAIRKYIAGEHP